jgi:DNA-damage-inducible protein J
MTTIQLRIDAKTKREAKKVFTEMGLDMSSGIKVYLSRVAQDKNIPFVVRTENGYTSEQEQEIIREVEWAKKHAKRYDSVDEIMKEFFGKKKKK